jgi:hypothetical protein
MQTTALGQEYVQPNEDAIIAEMVNELEAQLDRLYADKKMLRQIHTKMHGCVKASFTVENNLTAEQQVGVFKPGTNYKAWVRFSNASTKPQSDKKKDVRGAAIKLMNVPGEKILNDEHLQQTQDFLLMNSETFFSTSIKEFRELLKAATAKSKLKLLIFALNPLHWGLLKRVKQSLKADNNMLGTTYWSTQPYQYGSTNQAVKYKLAPSSQNYLVNENTSDYNYLSYNLAHTLNGQGVYFDFLAQWQTNAETMPIENPTVAWTSPFIKLATLYIPPQIFNSPEQMEFGDNLSFNSWHCLPEHRPLGSFNRARRRVYEALSEYRHKKNEIPMQEPTADNDFLQNTLPVQSYANDIKLPASGLIKTSAQTIIKCNAQTAFDYISSSTELTNWMKKVGAVQGCKVVEIIQAPYNQVGAKRKVIFNDNSSVVEQLLSFHPYAHYSYQVTKFSNFFKHLCSKAYGQVWIDAVDDKTRVNWVYAYTSKNILVRPIVWLFTKIVFKKFMKTCLHNAQQQIEAGD